MTSVRQTIPLLLLLLCTAFTAVGQPLLSVGTMGPVLDNPSRVSGNYGEIRSNHLHSGIDYKTNESTGLPVYAAADGYVSRIKVSGGGYGKALYLTHPQLSVATVYAHLRAYVTEVEDTVKQLMFSREQYDTELFPDADFFPVKRGQLIGYTGHTGSSEGPHLHFETRELESERPFNPQRAGYLISDTVPPEIINLAIYRPGYAGSLSGAERQLIAIPQDQSRVNLKDTLNVSLQFFVGFEGYDRAGIESNALGIRSWEFRVGKKVYHSALINAFSFDQTRMVNAMIDYGYKIETGRTLTLCHTLPGNKLPLYGKHNGVVELGPDEVRNCILTTEDESGNIKQIAFVVRAIASPAPVQPPGRKVAFNVKTTLTGDGFELLFHPNSLMEDTYVEVIIDSASAYGTPIIKILPEDMPLFIPAELSITTLEPFHPLVPVHIGNDGTVTALSGRFHGTIRIRQLGTYSLMTDSVAPTASLPVWVKDDWSGQNILEIPASDSLSGIRDYRVEINGQWVPAAWSEFHGTLTVFPEYLPLSGDEIQVKVLLSDGVSNRSEQLFTIKR